MTFIDALNKLCGLEATGVDVELPLEVPPVAAGHAAPPQPLWQMSSFELMNGLDITDFADTLDQRTFDELFPRGSAA